MFKACIKPLIKIIGGIYIKNDATFMGKAARAGRQGLPVVEGECQRYRTADKDDEVSAGRMH